MSDQPFKELVLLTQADYHRLTERPSHPQAIYSQSSVPPGSHQSHAQNPSLAVAGDPIDGSVGSVSGGQVNNIELAAPGSKVVIEADPNKKGAREIVASTKKLPSSAAAAAVTPQSVDASTSASPSLAHASTNTDIPPTANVSTQTLKPRLLSKKMQTIGAGQADVSSQTQPHKRVSFATQTVSPQTHARGQQAGPQVWSRGTQPGPATSTVGTSTSTSEVALRDPGIMVRRDSLPPPVDRRASFAPGLSYNPQPGVIYHQQGVPVGLDDQNPYYHHQDILQDMPYVVELPPDEDDEEMPAPQLALPAPPRFLPITHEQANQVDQPHADEVSQAGKVKKTIKSRRSSVFKKDKPTPSIQAPAKKRGRPRKKPITEEEERALQEHVRTRLQTLTSGRKKSSSSSSSPAELTEPKVRSSPKSPARPKVLASSRGRKRVRGTRTTDPDVMSERITVPYKTRRTTGKLPGVRRRHYDEWLN